MQNRLIPLWAIIILSSLLASCASLSPNGKISDSQDLSTLQHWQVRGKLAVMSPEDNVTGYLTWEQNQRAYDIFIAGPFGARSSRLSGDHKHANLLLPGWKYPQQARNAEELMSLHLGWDFPVASLNHWIKGQVAPRGKSQATYDEHGLLSELQQHGWHISYSRYQLQQGYWLPKLIKIQGYNYRFTFAISQWNLYDH